MSWPRVGAGVLVASVVSVAWGEEGARIDRFAPVETFLVVDVPDWGAARERAMATSLGDLWERAEMRTFVEGLGDDLEERFDEAFADVGLDFDQTPWPSGHVGLAMSAHEGEDGEMTTNVTFVADFGAGADAFEDVLNDLLDHAEERDVMRVTEEREGDVTIITARRIEVDEEEGEEEEFGPASFLPEPAFEQGWLQIARLGDAMVVSSVPGVIGRAIDVWEGDDLDAPEDAEAYVTARRQLPDSPDAKLIAYVPERLGGGVASLFEEFPLPLPMDAQAFFEELGLGSLESGALSVRFGAGGGVLESVYAVQAPEKTGLVELADRTDGPFDPPAFAGPDSARVSRVMFDFGGLFEVVRGLASAVGEDFRAQAEGFLQAIEPVVDPLLRNLGPEIWVVTQIQRPLEANSSRQVLAFELDDEQEAATGLMGAMGLAQAPLQAQDFEGGTIWAIQGDDSNVIGLGLGHLFLGSGPDVRAAMRGLANPESPKLTGERAFARAVEPLSDEAVWYGYTSMRPSLEFAWWQVRNMNRIAYEAIEQDPFMDEELKREFLEDMSREPDDWVKALPPVDVVLEYLGDLSGEVVSTDEGFRGRFVWFEARE